VPAIDESRLIDEPSGQSRLARIIGRTRSNRRLRELAAYLLVSIIAMVLDIAIFTALLWTGLVSSTVAGSVSYLIALVIHYLIAVRFVFRPEQTGKSRKRLAGEYIATGFVGVSITAITIHLLTAYLGAWPHAAKAVGIGASFVTVYALRSFLVFKPADEPMRS
jgi:putative flippase GtrA